MMDHPYGWLSLLPPAVAIVLAILTRRVVLSLVLGIFSGALLTNGTDVLGAVTDTLELHLWRTFTNPGKLRVFSFTLLMGAMIGVINRAGGMHGLVQAISPWANTRRRGQLMTWFLGLLIFFDDYANTLLLGNTLQPLCDRLRISREKLAYLVDSTAAPVAGLALVSTWVAVEIDYVRDGLENIGRGVEVEALDLFLYSIPYRFYVLLALVFVPLTAIMNREFGPMLKAERQALQGKSPPDAHHDLPPQARDRPRWYNAVLPIALTLGMVVLLIYQTGYAESVAEGVPLTLRNIVGNADSSLSLQYGALAGLVLVSLLARCQDLLTGPEVLAAAGRGVQVVLPAIAILWCASTLSKMTGNQSVDSEPTTVAYQYRDHRLYTGDFLKTRLGGESLAEESLAGESMTGDASDQATSRGISPCWLPTTVFVISAIIAFATGTSWGTMGILLPMVVTLTYSLLEQGGRPVLPTDPILLSAIGGVLAGAIFGDHCSPISDTTVLSSQSSGCDHIAHVWTQMPYALAVAAVAVFGGTLPLGFGVSIWILLPLQVILLVVVLWVFGHRVATSEPGDIGRG